MAKLTGAAKTKIKICITDKYIEKTPNSLKDRFNVVTLIKVAIPIKEIIFSAVDHENSFTNILNLDLSEKIKSSMKFICNL